MPDSDLNSKQRCTKYHMEYVNCYHNCNTRYDKRDVSHNTSYPAAWTSCNGTCIGMLDKMTGSEIAFPMSFCILQASLVVGGSLPGMVVEWQITFPFFSLVNRAVYWFAHPRLDEKGTWIAKFTQDSLSSLTLQNSSRSYTVSNSVGPPILAFRVQSELWMRETHEEPGAEIRDESSESRDERSESKLDSTFSPPLGYSVKGDGRGGSDLWAAKPLAGLWSTSETLVQKTPPQQFRRRIGDDFSSLHQQPC